MFEARLVQGSILPKVLESVKDLLTEATWDCSEAGIQLQAMDGAHVALVALNLRADGFDRFRCDRRLALGMPLTSLSKIFKGAGADDAVTMRAPDEGGFVTFVFESPTETKVSDYEIRLLDLDQDQLAIPDTDYAAVVKLPSAELQRIVKDLSQFGDSIVVTASKEGVSFSADGDIGVTGNVKLAQSVGSDGEEAVTVELQEPISLTFACRYLNMFTKAACLAPSVSLSLSPAIPMLVEYKIGEIGHIRYYLAPKVEEDVADLAG